MTKLVISALLVLFSVPLAAEPGPTARWLMNEPATMMDLGLYRLSLYLWNITKPLPGTAAAKYGWDTDTMTIGYTEFTKEKNEAKRKEFCADRIRHLRLWVERSKLETHFSHSGFQTKGTPKNLQKELEQITKLEVELIKLTDPSAITQCMAPFVGKQIFYSE